MRIVEIKCRDIVLPLISARGVAAGRPQIPHFAVLSIRLPYHHVTTCHSGAKAYREIVTLRDCHLEPCMCLVEHESLEEVEAIKFFLILTIYRPYR
jgi:hypothetical protein